MVKRVLGLLALALAGTFVLAAVPHAQQASTPPAAGKPPIVFQGGIDLVTLTVAVRDRRGRVVRDLRATDFEVFDAGVSRGIRDFDAGAAPISLAVLLDISGSMAVGGNIDRARSAVAVAMDRLSARDDEAALFTFDTTLQNVVAFTNNLESLTRASLEGQPWGMTSLYDAVGAAARYVGERANRHRALLVITDGVDTGSRLSAPAVSAIASSVDVPVYLLTVVTPLDHPGGELAVVEADDAASDYGTLADLSRWTGGDMRVASTPAHTMGAIRDLFEELRYQYVITFESGTAPGWHPLDVRTRNGSLTVHARSGYMAGAVRSDQ